MAPGDVEFSDYIGMFAVTAGDGADERAAQMQEDHDDYGAIMLKALADRFAEALAEAMHERVRKDLWAYAADESFKALDLIQEAYQGIRPAPGYPACPDLTENAKVAELLVAGRIGVSVSEGFQLHPEQTTDAIICHHPQAKYFVV